MRVDRSCLVPFFDIVTLWDGSMQLSVRTMLMDDPSSFADRYGGSRVRERGVANLRFSLVVIDV
jgi:hypothetical protein